MQHPTRPRRRSPQAVNRIESTLAAVHMPAGLLPFAIAIAVLIAVPIARASTTNNPNPSATGASGGAVAIEAASKPAIRAKLVSRRSIGGSSIRVTGRLRGTGRGKSHVRLSVRAAGARAWRTVASGNFRADEKFTLRWRGHGPGRYMTRVSVRKFGRTAVDRTGRAWVFRRSFASYYGPGFYGGALACGGRLSPGTVGVAHKTLPCGTRVAFKVGRRIVTARVIDRGPYVAGRDWDLTSALKNKLGFGSTGVVYATR